LEGESVTPHSEGSSRNRYLDSLRAGAIVRVVIYHAFGWAWLTVFLPAMGVMFAVAGSLMAASIAKHGARRAVTSRIRRLLPALWAFGAIAVPLMLWHGWSSSDPEHPLRWPELVFWLVPISDPPGNTWGEPLWEVLWYLRAYLLFVLASPVLFLLYRRVSWLVVAAPLAGLAVLLLTGFRLPDPVDGIMWDFVTYCACWVAGFAHRDGRLARLPIALYGLLVAGLAAIGLYYLYTHPTADGFDLNEVPVARTLWSLGFVLLVLRWRPAMQWLDRMPTTAKAVRLVNARAVTIYLWHYPLISIATIVLTYLTVPWGTPKYDIEMIIIEFVLVIAAVMAFGWVEDVAARRRPSLWPTGGGARTAPSLGPSAEPSHAGSAGRLPAGSAAPLPAATASAVPLPAAAGSAGPRPAAAGSAGPRPAAAGSAAPLPAAAGTPTGSSVAPPHPFFASAPGVLGSYAVHGTLESDADERTGGADRQPG
jgi:peptidoglycan/LPS O-acetylase OafA/YrhL